jgi:hypothetical protein
MISDFEIERPLIFLGVSTGYKCLAKYPKSYVLGRRPGTCRLRPTNQIPYKTYYLPEAGDRLKGGAFSALTADLID